MYPGGKNGAGVYQTIINQMPPHTVYIEPFLGSGAVLRMKKPAASSIAVDRDEDVTRSFLAENGDWCRRQSCTVICGDGIRFLQHRRNWTGRELVYCDPPYLMSTRRQHRPIYRCELEEQDHIELLGTLKTLPCFVIVSGYPSPLYADILADWRVVEFETMTRGGSKATELLWMNYPVPAALHDYRFLGTDFREREKLKRRARRLASKLEAMTPTERLALSAALAENGVIGSTEIFSRSRSSIAESGDAVGRPGRRIEPINESDDKNFASGAHHARCD